MSIDIAIFYDGEEKELRNNWQHVPRKGDYIKTLKGWALIEEVNWHGTKYPQVTLHVSISEKQ